MIEIRELVIKTEIAKKNKAEGVDKRELTKLRKQMLDDVRRILKQNSNKDKNSR